MRGFVTNIDLSGMDPPDIIETLDYETIRTALLDDMQARMEADGMDFDVRDLESDPAVKVLEVAADREVILRARVNGAAKALLLALSKKHDLEQLGYWYAVQRELVSAATEVSAAVYEDDERLRARVQIAPQAFSTAGPVGAYIFHVMTAAPTVVSVGITKQRIDEQVYINIYPMVADGDGTPSEEVLNAIRIWLDREDVAPLTDVVSVSSPMIVHTDISVTLLIKEGPDPDTLMANAEVALQEYAAACHKVGEVLYQSGIYAAAKGKGVSNVIINEPVADLDPGEHGAVYVDSIIVNWKPLVA